MSLDTVRAVFRQLNHLRTPDKAALRSWIRKNSASFLNSCESSYLFCQWFLISRGDSCRHFDAVTHRQL